MTLCSLGSMLGQTPSCPERSADSVVRQVQESAAFMQALRLTQRHYLGTAPYPQHWLRTICSGTTRSVPRSVSALTIVRAEMAIDLEALVATFAVRGDSVVLLNHVAADTTLDRTMDLQVWNRVFPAAMPSAPPGRDMSAALEYACLFEELNANRATNDVGHGQCTGRVFSVEQLPTRGVSVLTETSQVEISDRWVVLSIRRR